MKFRLQAPHYILDRYLEAEVIITPSGFCEPFMDGDRVRLTAEGEIVYGPEQKWTTIDGRETRTWRGPPSMMMAPLDKEAEAAAAKWFTGRSSRPPEEGLPLRG